MMEQKISTKSWRTTVTLYHLFGILGIHRFYVGKIPTGLLWLFTGGLFLVGAMSDLVKLYTGNFTDADGDVVLPPAKMLLLQELRRSSQSSSATQRAPSAPGVIHMNPIRPQEVERIAAIQDCFVLGIIVDNDKITDLAILKITGEQKELVYDATSFELSSEKFLQLFGSRATLVGYDIRAKFPAIGHVLRDVEANAEWDYLDLKALSELKGVDYEPRGNAIAEAQAASELFFHLRGQ